MFSFSKKKQSVYEVPTPPHLIQSIRICQAVMEANLTLNIKENQKETFEYLGKFFPTNFVINSKSAIKLNIEMSHSVPYVRIGNETRPLLFPNKMFEICSKKRKEPKKTDFHFEGIVTPKRKIILDKFSSKIQTDYPNSKLVILESLNGRQFPVKAWDDNYYTRLAQSKFVICPNGDFIWTYRFFEAILCGAIPIVEEPCEIYKDFLFLNFSSSQFEYDSKMVEKNINHAKQILFMESDQIRRLLT